MIDKAVAGASSVIVNTDVRFAMRFGLRSKLGAMALAATCLAAPLALVASTPSKAQFIDADEGLYGNKKQSGQRNKANPLKPPTIVGNATTNTEILVDQKRVYPILTPDSAEAMRTLLTKYSDISANGGFPKVPKGTFKKGANNKAVVALNQRLFIEGYVRREATEGEFASIVTSATVDAVTRFQRNMGLAATGLVDGPTLAALNVPAEERVRTINANIARLEAYSKDLGERYLVVNVPSQQIETVSNGKVFSRHNAIVGRPERPTPVVMTSLSDINFNPYWNAPVSIVENDIIPKLRSGTNLLTDMNMKVFQGFGGPEIDPRKVNWSRAVPDDYHFRQEPGPHNAMATAKINFSSPFGIYLHDTPEQHLFKSGQRLYSSGCVRVEKVDLLLEWILNGQDGIGGAEIAALAETLERRDVKLTTPPQLRVTYLTAWPAGNVVAFRPDVYDLDGTNFIVGQPLPAGEVSDAGERFVLKPVPRKAAAVEDAEAEGFGLFGTRLSRPKLNKPRRVAFNGDAVEDVRPPAIVKKNAPKPVATQKVAERRKPAVKKSSGFGFFDWANYRKELQQSAKKKAQAADLNAKKKAKPKIVAAAAVVKKDAPAKKLDDKATKKVAAADPKAVKKPVVETVKKPVSDAAKKPDAIAKKPDAGVKKSAVSNSPKKAAQLACLADSKEMLPKGCKKTEKKPTVKKPAAVN
jgi:L,D-transpeptidase YcbB